MTFSLPHLSFTLSLHSCAKSWFNCRNSRTKNGQQAKKRLDFEMYILVSHYFFVLFFSFINVLLAAYLIVFVVFRG